MANSYVCVQCGWQESVHIEGGFALSEEERAAMFLPKDGYELTQIQCAQSYEPSQEELEYDAAQRVLNEGQHEGQH